jgi:hypothetical protein
MHARRNLNRWQRDAALKLFALALLWTLAPLAPAFAHSQEDEAACRPDVMRLCKLAIPNVQRIVACLSQNKQRLSFACYKVFDREPSRGPVPNTQVEAQPHRWGQ